MRIKQRKMEKHSIQFSVIALAMGVGFLLGSFLTKQRAEEELEQLNETHKQELIQQDFKLKEVIQQREEQIKELEVLAKTDSLTINSLLFKIKQDGLKLEQKRNDAAKLNTSKEKLDWFNTRYNSTN